jgi:hypothetical protein
MRVSVVVASTLLLCSAVSCAAVSSRPAVVSHGSGQSMASAGSSSGSGRAASLAVSALAHAAWRHGPRSPLGNRDDPIVVWDGRDLLEIGGTVRGVARSDGAAFDPAVSAWHQIAPAPGSIGTAGAATVWTGREVFLFGGRAAGGTNGVSCCVAGLYDPVGNVWSTSTAAPIGALTQVAAVWTGTEVVVAGIGHDQQMVVATYDPAADRWARHDPPHGARHPVLAVALGTASGQVILWSMWGRTEQTGPGDYTGYSGIEVYRLGPDAGWRDVSASWPQYESVPGPLTAGAQVLVPPTDIWCGACSHPPRTGAHGYLIDPVSMHLTAIPRGPLDDARPQLLWTGAAAIAVAQSLISGGNVNIAPGDVAFWNPVSRTWTKGPRPPERTTRTTWTAAWATHQLILLASNGSLLTLGP